MGETPSFFVEMTGSRNKINFIKLLISMRREEFRNFVEIVENNIIEKERPIKFKQ
tara:strand:- start:851 stop:1015 length:165 start_codon:yes stop_codon:yes gene_type:complete